MYIYQGPLQSMYIYQGPLLVLHYLSQTYCTSVGYYSTAYAVHFYISLFGHFLFLGRMYGFSYHAVKYRKYSTT